jgi:phage N-6-adenine-methyltransferase
LVLPTNLSTVVGMTDTFYTSIALSSRSDDWPTPQAFYDELAREFGGFDLDPCASADNAKCPRFFTPANDGLTQEWAGRVFMNPPYGRSIGDWMRKAYESAQAGALVVCLVPSRTDTRWWHDYAAKGEVRFIKGRLKFGDGKHPAPFPSAVVIFRPHLRALRAAA